MTVPRAHILNIAVGERFRYEPDGAEFQRIADADGRIRVIPVAGFVDRTGTRPAKPATAEFEGCYVYPSRPDRGEDEETFELWEGLK